MVLQIRDGGEIGLEHGAIAGEPERAAIVLDVGIDIVADPRPVLVVEAIEIAEVALLERGHRHQAAVPRPARAARSSRPGGRPKRRRYSRVNCGTLS